MKIRIDTALHELGYTYNGSAQIGLLTWHEIQRLMKDRALLNQDRRDLENDWKQRQLDRLVDMKGLNYEG